MNKSNPIWVVLIVVMLFFLIFNIVLSSKISEYNEKMETLNQSNSTSIEAKKETAENCPDATGGLGDAFLRIKYFYSKYCPWCVKEEPILQDLVQNHGNLVSIGWYDINECPELVDKYKIGGVPSFVFSTIDNETEYSHYGFIPEEDIIKLTCDVNGAC